MLAYKLDVGSLKCQRCQEILPPYITKCHKVVIFTEEQAKELGDFPGEFKGSYVEYNDKFLTIQFEEQIRAGWLNGI
jgi:hypothetical protein